ncbi:MAG: glycoside hydrolase family 16 protein [Odoribacteraceae bacterium]|jgi:beta-glucanase (GH16 family)|nr:glycoside hydrolase family 16 protein [Odoribacteraceae bacterium]
MKRVIILTLYILATFSCATRRELPVVQAPVGYELVWSDEFNIDGPPDTSAWSHETGFSRNEEIQWYQSANAICRDGLLVITARAETMPNPWFVPGSRDWKRNRERIEFTSSCIKTVGKKEFLHGRFEIRARIPVAPGSWPAIWTLGREMPWPSNGEIDIMEFYRIKDVPHLLANTAWGTDTPWNARWDSATIPLSRFTANDPGWASRFHVWRMDWDEEAIRLYLDDELLNETLLSGTRNGSIGNYTNPFHQPHYILLNLAVGSNGGPPELSSFPLIYEIDHVRVFQKKK